MKRNKAVFLSIFLIITLMLLLTACTDKNTNSSINIGSKAPEPSISITDISVSSKDANNKFDFVGNRSLFKQVFWSKSEKDEFYNGQIDVNDVNMEKTFENTALESGPLPQNYELEAMFGSTAQKPTLILGKILDDQGNAYTWNQSYKKEDKNRKYLINLPSFQGETVKVVLRFIWLNDNQKCYGVADKSFILKKQ